MAYPQVVEKLIENLTKLPGIGRKTATRLAFFLLNSKDDYVKDLAQSIVDIKEKIKLCSVCLNITDMEPCLICKDEKRDKSKICVVEEPAHVMVMEQAYPGVFTYHVLHGVINPLEGIGPENLRIQELIERVKNSKITEVVIATNLTLEGNTTAYYIADQLKEMNVKVTRIASGIPAGGDIVYADPQTIKNSLDNRRLIS
ncbi:MAG: recombination mediator RecR [Desulfobacterota bacterium]|nr:recombination mediator RecR [Thermodesulfobacteriota bacterium]MDW8001472.1 recombination mediator RecR [Deltaproteobacteria bacterium]